MEKDWGADPLGDGMFKMVPSGDIVTLAERMKRLPPNLKPLPDGVFGKSWAQIEAMQKGKIKFK